MTWLLSIAAGRRWLAYLYLFAIVIVLVAIVFGSVYLLGFQSADHKAEVKELKQEVSAANQRGDDLERQQHENDIVVAQLGAQQHTDGEYFRDLRIDARALEENDVDHVCPVSRHFVRLWDRAIELPDAASGTTLAAADAGDTRDNEPSEVTQGDILDNHIENAERERHNYRQCSALIEWHQKYDRKVAK
jgi:hypothetical protein